MHGDDEEDEEDMSHDEGEEDDDDDDDVIDDEILDASGRHDDERDVALGVRRLQARSSMSRDFSHADTTSIRTHSACASTDCYTLAPCRAQQEQACVGQLPNPGPGRKHSEWTVARA